MSDIYKLIFFIQLFELIFSFTLVYPRTYPEFVDVDIPNLGKLRGKTGKSFFTGRTIYHFLGINYAVSPSKDRRFQVRNK